MRATAISGDKFRNPITEATIVEDVTMETVNEPVLVVMAAASRNGKSIPGMPELAITSETDCPKGDALITPPKAPPAPVIMITTAAF